MCFKRVLLAAGVETTINVVIVRTVAGSRYLRACGGGPRR